jgi:pimeloyl-ACP methyl ester carboxylesterase/HEAT repeat protein
VRTIALSVTLVLVTLFAGPVCLRAQEVPPETYVERLADPTLKGEAVAALNQMGSSALPALKKALFSKRSNEYLRREVLKLLPAFGKKGISLVEDSLRKPALEMEAIKQLANLPADRALQKLMMDRLSNSLNPKVRSLALEWLVANGDPEKVNAKLFVILSDPSDQVRDRAGELVASRVGVNALPQLMEMLRKAELSRSPANLGLRQALLKTLGFMAEKRPSGAGRIVPTILRSLGEEDEQDVAIQVLINIGAPSVSSLLMILKAGDTHRAAAAMDALLAIGQKAAPEVVSLLRARHPKMKRMAQQFLGFYQDPAVFPLLRELYPRVNSVDKAAILRIASLYGDQEPHEFIIEATLAEDPIVRTAAVELLAASGKPGSVPVLLTRAEEDADLDIRLTAVRGLYGLGESSAVAPFGRMLEYEKWQVRLELLRALAWMGNPMVVKSVSEQLRHRKSEVANLAARGLANITYLSGQRSPEEWVSDVNAILGSQEDSTDVVKKSIQAGDETVEIAVLGNSRQTILYLSPNLSLNQKYLARYLSQLADDYTVVVIPMTGCDGNGGQQLTLVECADRMVERAELVRQEVTEQPVVVMGHSVTGFGAIRYGARYPRNVRSIVIADAVFPRRFEVEVTQRRTQKNLPVRWRKEMELLEQRAGELVPRARFEYLGKIELAALVRAEGRAMFVSSGYYGLSWLMHDVFFPYEDTTIESDLAALTVPLLLVFGDHDYAADINREAYRKIGRIRRNLVTTRLAGCQRFSIVEKPKAFQKAVLHFIQSYQVAMFPEGVGGGVSRAVTALDSQPGNQLALTALSGAPANLVKREGALVESSVLTQFLSSHAPDKVISGQSGESDNRAETEALEAEAARLAAEARIAKEAVSKAKEVRLQEAARIAEEKRIAQESLRLEEAQRVEEERLAAESARKAEEVSLAEDAARKAEEARVAESLAKQAEEAALRASEQAELEARKAEKDKQEGASAAIITVSPPIPTKDSNGQSGDAQRDKEKAAALAAAEAERQAAAGRQAAEAAKAAAAKAARQAEEAARRQLEADKAAADAARLEADKRAADAARLEADKRVVEEGNNSSSKTGDSISNSNTTVRNDNGIIDTPATGAGGITRKPHDPKRKYKLIGWGLLGGGLLVGGTGGFMTYMAKDRARKANALDPNLPDYDGRFDKHLKGAQTWQTMSIVGYALSAVGLLAGLDLIFGWPIAVGQGSGTRTAISLSPLLQPNGGGVMLNWFSQ